MAFALAAAPRRRGRTGSRASATRTRDQDHRPGFAKYRLNLAKVERIATGMRWAEGPVWFGDGRFLLWSDIPNNRIMRWDEETGAVSVFRKPARTTPTATPATGRGGCSPASTTPGASPAPSTTAAITVIADKYDGKPLNSPNDVVCKSDGSIWFTDPPFGILGYYEGHVAKPELPTNVYRWDPKSGKLAVVAGDVNRPNGLAFSPDESKLYIVEAGVTPRVIRAYEVTDGGTRLGKGAC